MKEKIRELLRTYVANLVDTDVAEDRTPISDAREFAEEFVSDFWNELTEAFENYEALIDTAKNLPILVEIPLFEINDYLDLKISDSFEEAIQDYLMDKYSCAVNYNGFSFEIDNDIVKVSDIEWNTEETL